MALRENLNTFVSLGLALVAALAGSAFAAQEEESHARPTEPAAAASALDPLAGLWPLSVEAARPRPVRGAARRNGMLETSKVGLSGRRMVKANARRAVAGGGAFRADGQVPVGRLSVRRKDSKGQTSEKVLGLRTLDISTQIEGLTARTTVKHVFENETGDLLEGVFTFTLPPGVAVDRFAMTIHGESDLMEASLVERRSARNIYRTLVYGRAVDPGLLEWLDERTFRATVFPIPPRGTKTIVISFLQVLPQSIAPAPDGRRTIIYRYPLLARGRAGGASAAIPPATHLKLKAVVTGWPVNASLSGSLDAKIERGVWGERIVRAAFHDGQAPLDDWVVRIETPPAKDPAALRCLLQAHRPDAREPGFFALTLTPRLPQTSIPDGVDVLFMLDSSASRTAREYRGMLKVVESALKNLDSMDRFAVLAFDVQARAWAKVWKSPTAQNTAQALRFLRNIHPLGATDVAGAFRGAAQRFAPGARSHARVIFLGDAEATYGAREKSELRKTVSGALKSLHAEMFAVWPGRGAGTSKKSQEREQLAMLAELSGGPVFKFGSGVLPGALGWRLARNLNALILRHAKVEMTFAKGAWKGEPVAALDVMGGLLGNASHTLLGRYDHNGPATVTLTGTADGKPYRESWRVQLPAFEHANAAVAKLWARERIGQLQAENNTAEALQLAKARHVLSRGTAFLVLESEQMYRDFHIRRTMRFAPQRHGLKVKLLAGIPAFRNAHPSARTSGGPAPTAAPLHVFEGAVNGQALNEPFAIGGVWVNVALHQTRVSKRQTTKPVWLTSTARTDRRLKLSRLIAFARGLPFEPETVFPQLWLQFLRAPASLAKRFALDADAPVWSFVGTQPTQGPFAFQDPWDAPSARVEQLDKLMHPRKPSLIQVAPDGQRLQLDSHLLAHKLLQALIWNRAPGLRKAAASPQETMRLIKTRVKRFYALKDLPTARLAALWNFLAQLALVEGQPKLAETMAHRALHLAPPESAKEAPAPRLGYLLKALAEHLRGDIRAAAGSYREILRSAQPLSQTGYNLMYWSLIRAMVLGGDKPGAVAVLERWFARATSNKALLARQLGRGYLLLDRPGEAIRAFSTVAEFDPAQGKAYPAPAAFLQRFHIEK